MLNKILLGIVAITAAAAGTVIQAAETRVFNIPPGELAPALESLAKETGLELVFRPDELRGIRTQGVSGNLSPQEAVAKLIHGTNLRIKTNSAGAILISTTRSVTPAEPTAGMLDAEAIWVAELEKAGNKEAGAPLSPAGTADRDHPETSAGASEDKAQEIIVTGTRFGGRNTLTSPVPIAVVSSEELRAGGRTELAESLAAAVPSFNFPPVEFGSSGNALRPFTLRGLPASQTLILVNGKRWHPTAIYASGRVVFDFNSFPPTSVGSVEVLRDGASAQYGSDAIAGVINLRMRRDIGMEFIATTGQYYQGDGLTVESGLDSGWSIRDDGFLHVSAYFRDVANTNRQGRDVQQQYFALDSNGNPVATAVSNVFTQTLPAGLSFDPREFTGVDRLHNWNYGNAERRETGLTFNSEIPISAAVTAYGFGGYTYRTSDTVLFWRPPRDSRTVRAIQPDGFAPVYDARIVDAQMVAGARGRASDWEWDLSQTWGFNRVANYGDSLNASFGAASPTSFFSGVHLVEQATTNIDVKRDFDIGLRSPLRVALGSEYRREGMEERLGEPASYLNGGVPVLDGPFAGTPAAIGAQALGGNSPLDVVDTSRNSIAAYIDLEHQVTEQFLLAIAGRYEHYSDFGSTLNGKLAFRQEFNPIFALRGSVSTGFRAPSLIESYYSNTSGAIINGQFVVFRQFPVGHPVAQALGAQSLEPEESTHYSLGSVITVNDRLSFTVDVYRVDVREALIRSSFFTGTAFANYLASQGFTGVGSAAFYTNAIDERVEGVDLEGRYTIAFRNGSQLTLSSGVNFNDIEVVSVDPTPPQLAAVTTVPLFDQAAVGRVERGAPDSRINVSAVYRYRGLEVSLRETRYGSTAVEGMSPQADQVFGAEWVTDLDVTYDLSDTVRLTAGGQNIFDAYPDKANPLLNLTGVTTYGGAPFGFNGGYYYLRALLRF